MKKAHDQDLQVRCAACQMLSMESAANLVSAMISCNALDSQACNMANPDALICRLSCTKCTTPDGRPDQLDPNHRMLHTHAQDVSP